MPAAVAIPAIASVVGGGISAIAQHKAQGNASKQQQNRINQAQNYANQDYQQQLDFRNQLMGGQGQLGSLFQQMVGPQTSTSNSNSFSETDSSGTSGLVKTPELLATRTRAAQAAGEVPFSLAGMLQNQFANIAASQRAGQAAEQNLAASRGIDPTLARAAFAVGPSEQAATMARNNALQGVNQEAFARAGQARQEQAGIEQMLADTFQNQKSTTRARQSGSQTGPGNIGQALGFLAPPQHQYFV